MNREQVKYAISRIKSVASSKRNEVTAKYNSIKPKRTIGDIVKLIKEGNFTFKHCFDIDSPFDYSLDYMLKFPPIVDENTDKVAKLIQEINEKERQMVDELMLGDVAEALEKIKEFESMEIE